MAIYETDEVEVLALSAAVGLASFDGHAGEAGVGGAEDGARINGLARAARVGLAGGGEPPTIGVWIDGLVDEGVVGTFENRVEDAVEDFIVEMVAGVEVDDNVMDEILGKTA